MIKEYPTILQPGMDEIVEKKSRFIGHIFHVETEEEAMNVICDIKKKHYDARHNCYAYSIGETQPLLRFSDDGEPGGTAGKPILEVINGYHLCNVCIVVTRYFGGTLLGTGGLVRAYTDASKACIGATDIVYKRMVKPLSITTNYTDLGKIQYILGNEKIETIDSVYEKDVLLKVEIFVDDIERIKKSLIEVTASRVCFDEGECKFSIFRNK